MDDHGSQGTPRSLPPAARKSTKGKAPPPPAAKGLNGQRLSLGFLGSPLSAMDQKENLNDKDLDLTVVLPGGVEKMATVPGSKPMMDLLVMLCAKYHLNPSGHTIELVSTNRNHIKFKPNALIGTLEAEKILLKPKGVDEKSKKMPQMPEATVRLVINYKKTQKTILRVNPRVPLEELMPAVCEKCEFDKKTSFLLRDFRSEEPLDLTKCLNDFGLREVYARDTKSVNSPEFPSSPIYEGNRSPSYKSRSFKEKENKGLFSMFRRSKKKSGQAVSMSAPTSPVLSKPRPMSMPLLGASASVYNSNATLSDVPKKRRAPLPPTMVLQRSMSNTSDPQTNSPNESFTDGERVVSGFRRASSKRKAPPPPPSPSAISNQDVFLEDGSIKAGSVPHSPLEQISEQEEMVVSTAPDPSAAADVQMDDTSPDASTDIQMDSGITELPPPPSDFKAESLPPPLDGTGEDQLNDLSSDGKPAQDPVSDKECTEQALNSVEVELEHGDSAGTDLSPPAEVEQTVHLEEGASVLVDDKEKSDSGACTAPSTPEIPAPPVPQPLTQDAETLTSDGQSVKAPQECAETVDGPTSLAGDVSPAQPVVQPPQCREASSPTEAAQPKRDMSTSTEELPQGEASPTLPQEPKNQPIYLLDYAPKPKPSNELTREYIPKVGLTTYTIVPQKSMEKLRFYEVELTLEPPGSVPGQIVAVGPEHCLAGVPAEQLELRNPTFRVGSPLSNGRAEASRCYAFPGQPVSMPAQQYSPPAQPYSPPAQPYSPPAQPYSPPAHPYSPPAHPYSPPAHPYSPPAHPYSPPAQPYSPSAQQYSPPAQTYSPPADGKPLSRRSWAAAAAGVLQKKVPPPTKPKPGSFRLSLQKRTSGYVTSAAVKSANVGHASGRTEVATRPDVGRPAEASEEENFPPPPPPLLWTEEVVTGRDQPRPREEKVDGPAASGLHGPAANLDGPAPRPNDSTHNVDGPAPKPADPTPNVTIPVPKPADPSPSITVPAPKPADSTPTVNALAAGPADPTPNITVPAPKSADPTPSVSAPTPSASGSPPKLTRQYSLPARDPAVGLSLERLRSFLAPKPYKPASQSRFAKAVSTAIRRSHSFNKASSADPQPAEPLPASPLANQYSIQELAEPSRSPEKEAREREEGMMPVPQQEEQPDCGTSAAVPSKTPGESDRGATPDAPADANSPLRPESGLPSVADPLPPLSVNGAPTEI
ncbi:cordon-bleu protein-like 1b isoform X2 [Conger conger]|uniref:cordon-bleu protein-like 1b isoform X2 n=1 Tax=Conger conger TaxID=82655 RepID=UPI002A5AA5D9|nr:cordon-bleu protein-like 1b isoform X2 [Conger conger]